MKSFRASTVREKGETGTCGFSVSAACLCGATVVEEVEETMRYLEFPTWIFVTKPLAVNDLPTSQSMTKSRLLNDEKCRDRLPLARLS